MHASGGSSTWPRVLQAFCTCSSLILRASAIDFAFNQQHPTGQPLVSSFFGVPGTSATFDYAVVGGGTGGLAIATRLAEANLSVAVIEAGGFYETDNSNLSVVPAYATFFTGSNIANFQPLVDWAIHTTVQAGSGNRRLHYARGKTLGGSSARNYMLYQRSTVDTQQLWADQVNDQSWTWDNLLPYYKKAVNYTAYNASLYINTTNLQDPAAFAPGCGPVQVSFSNTVDPFGTWVRHAMLNASIPQLPGLNCGNLIGGGYATIMVDPKTGYRSSSEASYLQSALNAHKAPFIYKNTLGYEILFNGTTATGVVALTAGTFGTPSVNFTLTARKEVIVSAGAFQSPQLLMVSGIGNCTELASSNISCKVDLPGVGQNMWDHSIWGSAHAVQVLTSSAGLNNATVNALNIQRYIDGASGPLSIFGPDYYSFEKLPEPYRSNLTHSSLAALASFPPDWPEIEWLPVSAYNGDNSNKQANDPRDGKKYATINNALVAPLSRGTVKLASANMWDLPIIDPQWLTDPTDQNLAVAAFRRQRAVWQYLVEQGVADPEEAYPGPSVQTDAEVLKWVGESMTTVYHASCTCKMGTRNDTMAVVDSNARVFGTENMRVVDASAFAVLPPGHPTSLVYAFAEKIADVMINQSL